MSESLQVALITGAGSGIGAAAATELARRGYALALADLDGEALGDVIRSLPGHADRILGERLDVADDGAVKRFVDRVLERFGRLDVAFNNAGIAGEARTTRDYPLDGWRKVLDVNLTGIFLCMRHEIDAMRAVGGGSIVNTASVAGLRGAAGGAAYCASKHGVVGLTRAASFECARDGIRVNAICPGFIDTPMTRGPQSIFSPAKLERGIGKSALKRFGTPQEVARTVAWLLSDEASYLTGLALPVDGGITAGF